MINDWEQLHKEQMMKVVAHNHELQKEIDRLKNTALRELSDEEILEYVYAFSEQRCSIYSFQEDNILEMIRAILKKASEK